MVHAISFVLQHRYGRTQLGLHHRNRLIANTSLLDNHPFESQLEISIVLWDTIRSTRSVRTNRWVRMFPAEKYQSENQYRPDCMMDSHSKDCHPKDCHSKERRQVLTTSVSERRQVLTSVFVVVVHFHYQYLQFKMIQELANGYG